MIRCTIDPQINPEARINHYKTCHDTNKYTRNAADEAIVAGGTIVIASELGTGAERCTGTGGAVHGDGRALSMGVSGRALWAGAAGRRCAGEH